MNKYCHEGGTAHTFDENGICFECDAVKPYDQVAADRRYRAGQKARGIVRKSVLVPENRVQELQAMLKQWRAELSREGE